MGSRQNDCNSDCHAKYIQEFCGQKEFCGKRGKWAGFEKFSLLICSVVYNVYGLVMVADKRSICQKIIGIDFIDAI
jgi:hypothetical protein